MRRRVGLRALLPLALFLVCFCGVCAGLELADLVLFAVPTAFWLALVIPWLWWMHHQGLHGLVGARSHAALLTRLLVVAVLIALLAHPRAVRKSDKLSVVYALDISRSIGDRAGDQALSYVVRTVQEKPADDQAGLVVFGRHAAVELPPREAFPFEVINARVPRDGTSLERALSLSAAVLPGEHVGRIVLISDGTQTEGDVHTLLPELSARGISVDVLPIEYGFDREVWLERIDMPRVVKLGETYEAAIILSSLQAGSGTLVLLENDHVVHRQEVTFQTGKNRFALPLHFRKPGYYEYVARIEPLPKEDGWQANNVAMNYLYLKGEGKVLVVTDPAGDPREWAAMVEAMQKAELAVELRQSYAMPGDALSLLPYDSIVFANVPADAFNAIQFQAIHDAVRNQGTGFLMVGGRNGFGAGGYNRTPIEAALPVSMDIKKKKVLPKGALGIILHTCEFPEGNTWGKRIAKEAMRVLGGRDEVGVLVYNWGDGTSGEQWLFPLTPAAEYEKLVPLINKAQIGDMPSFGTTMEMGLEGLLASDAATRHMIIISDGDPSPPTPNLVARFVEAKISVTTVAINPHGGQEVAIMQTIAAETGGRYYFPQDPYELPSIFIKEAKTLKRSMIQNKTFTPSFLFPSPIMKGITALPPLHGYVLTMSKPQARNVLIHTEESENDPVLSIWRYGLGTTAAFTSSLDANWGRDWVDWERYRAFVKQLMAAVSRVDHKNHLYASCLADGTTGIVTIEDFHPSASFLELRAELTGPGGQRQTVPVKQVGPRTYRGTFPITGAGRYQVLVAASGENRQEQAIAGITVPYSPEFLRFRSNPIVLRRVAEATGGRLLTGQEMGSDIFGVDRRERLTTRSIAEWFLWVLACLVPLDVAMRRVQLDWRLVAEWFGARRAKASTPTLGALLERKRDVDTSLAAGKGAGLKPLLTRRHRAAAEAPPQPEKPSPETAPEREEPQTTTGRLLARKRKWKDEDDKETS